MRGRERRESISSGETRETVSVTISHTSAAYRPATRVYSGNRKPLTGVSPCYYIYKKYNFRQTAPRGHDLNSVCIRSPHTAVDQCRGRLPVCSDTHRRTLRRSRSPTRRSNAHNRPRAGLAARRPPCPRLGPLDTWILSRHHEIEIVISMREI